MIFLLTALMAIAFIVIFLINKKNILEPSSIFAFSFLALSVMASINYYNYDMNIGVNTFFVISMGVIEFSCICFLIKYIFAKKKHSEDIAEKRNKPEIKAIEVNVLLKIAFLIFVVLVNSIYVYYMVKAVGGSFGGLGEISASISRYDALTKFSNDTVRLPSIVSNARIIAIGAGYWFIYIIANNFIAKKKIKILDAIIVATIFASTFLSGSRGNAFFMLLAAFVFYLFLSIKFNRVSKKMIRVILVSIVSFVLLLIPIARLLGRNINQNIFEYTSIYCGAEMKNLDIYLNGETTSRKNDIWGSQTFYNIITPIGGKIGFEGYQPYKLNLPFRKVNGKSLGNVYTTFYPYIYDFGYIGEVVLVALMAAISQVVFEKAKRNNKAVNKPLMVYAIIFTCLLLSFFSNKFYENIFNPMIIKYIITWYICDWIFIKRPNLIRKKKNNEKIDN